MANVEYIFGDGFRLNAAIPRLFKGSNQIGLGQRPLSILLYLLEHRDRFVGAQEIFDKVFKLDTSIQNFRTHISKIYKAIGDTRKVKIFIINNGHGAYKFIGQVQEKVFAASPSYARHGAGRLADVA